MAEDTNEFDRGKLEEDIARMNAVFQGCKGYLVDSEDDEEEENENEGDDEDGEEDDEDGEEDEEEDDEDRDDNVQTSIEVGGQLTLTNEDESPLTRAIMLNRAYQEVIVNCIQRLELCLQDNQEKQRVLQEDINNISRKKKRAIYSSMAKFEKSFTVFASPYFKNKKGFAQPNNNDTKEIISLQAVDPYVRPPKVWTREEQRKLHEAVASSAREEAWQTLLNKKEVMCSKLERDDCEAMRGEISAQIEQIDKSIQAVSKEDGAELIGHRWKKHDWMKIAVVDFYGLRTSRECELIWTNHLHPDVNSKRWTPAEDSHLVQLIARTSDWEEIAQNMNNNRTAQQCMERYQTELNEDFIKSKWTPEEDDKLIKTIESCRIGDYIPWQRVVYHLKGRTRHQVFRRWNDSLDPKLHKGRWNETEDMMLIAAVARYGEAWPVVSQHIAGRNKLQCRDRWVNCLSMKLKFGSWSIKEDQILLDTVLVHGLKWAKIAQSLPGRTDAMVARRYHMIMSNAKAVECEDTETVLRMNDYADARSIPRKQTNRYRDHIYKKLKETLKKNVANARDGSAPKTFGGIGHPILNVLNVQTPSELDSLLKQLGENLEEMSQHKRRGKASLGRPRLYDTQEDTDIFNFFQYTFRPRGRPWVQNHVDDGDPRMDYVVSQYLEMLGSSAGDWVNPASVKLTPPTSSSLQAFKNLLMLRPQLLDKVQAEQKKFSKLNHSLPSRKCKDVTVEPNDAAELNADTAPEMSLNTVSKTGDNRIINVPTDAYFPVLMARFASTFFWPALLSCLMLNVPQEQPRRKLKDRFSGGRKRKVKKPWVAETMAKRAKQHRLGNASTNSIVQEEEAETEINGTSVQDPSDAPQARKVRGPRKKRTVVVPDSERRRSTRLNKSDA